MNISIKKLQPIHSKSYRKLRLESLEQFPLSFCSTYEEQKMKPKLSFQTYIEEENHSKFVVGAFDEDNLIGICTFCQESDEHGELIQMYVQSNYQGKNIGKQLIDFVKDIAFEELKLIRIELDVFTSSQAAHKLYQKLGFQETAIKKDFLQKNGNSFDLIMMELSCL